MDDGIAVLSALQILKEPKVVKFLIKSIFVVIIGNISPALAEKETLTIYTYSSFVSDWGPGPIIQERFEEKCACTIDFVSVADGAALLNRLKLEGSRSKADIILGLDTNLMVEAKKTGLLEPHGLNTSTLNLSIDWTDDTFLPYDYGHFAFVYDSKALESMPGTLKEFVRDTGGPRLIIQDPRTSTPGLGLVLWIRSVFGDKSSDAWSQLEPRILTVTKGWSEAYGLFLNGEAPIVLSYTTSPAYHRHVDQTDRYQAAEFSEGHYAQIEVAAKLSGSVRQELSDQFLKFMLSPGFQDVIPTTNWMFPVGPTSSPLPKAFSGLVQPQRTLLFKPEQVAGQRQQWVKEWLDSLSQ